MGAWFSPPYRAANIYSLRWNDPTWSASALWICTSDVVRTAVTVEIDAVMSEWEEDCTLLYPAGSVSFVLVLHAQPPYIICGQMISQRSYRSPYNLCQFCKGRTDQHIIYIELRWQLCGSLPGKQNVHFPAVLILCYHILSPEGQMSSIIKISLYVM